MHRARRGAFVCMLVLGASFLVACSDSEDEDGAPRGVTGGNSPVATAGTDDSSPEPSPSNDEEPLGDGEAVAFQAPGGETVRGVLLSAAGPNQRILVFAAPNAGRYRLMYSDLVEAGLAVLVFSAEGEAAAGQIETAVRLARSRDYPLIYVGGADDASEGALLAASTIDPAGVIVISPAASDFGNAPIDLATPKLFVAAEGSDGLETLDAAASEPKQVEAFAGDPVDSPKQVATTIRAFMMQ